MRSRSLSIAFLSLVLSGSVLSAGCDDSGETTKGTAGSGADGGSAGSPSGGSGGTGGSSGGSTDTGGTGGGTTSAAPEVVVAFDASKGQFIEGLDIKDGTAYIGVLLTGEVFSVDLADPAIKPFGNIPPFPQYSGSLVGLTVGPDGAVYGAVNTSGAEGPIPGIYRIDPAGGEAELFASDPELYFANDVRFDEAGDMFVSDSGSGTIFKLMKGDSAMSKWVSDALLTPDPTVCNVDTQYHLGINGFVRTGDAYYAVNTDRASIVKIPVNADGSAGTPEVFVESDCATLSGVDGMVVDPKTGDLLIAVNYQNKIIRVGMDKKITVVLEGDPLQSPASLAIEDGYLYVTSAAFAALMSDPASAKPSLAKLPLE